MEMEKPLESQKFHKGFIGSKMVGIAVLRVQKSKTIRL